MTNCLNNINNVVSFSDFNKGQVERIFDEVKRDGTKVVMKDNKPECILMSIDNYLSMINEINDTYALLMATERMYDFDEDYKNSLSQEEIEKMFKVNTDDCDTIEIQ